MGARTDRSAIRQVRRSCSGWSDQPGGAAQNAWSPGVPVCGILDLVALRIPYLPDTMAFTPPVAGRSRNTKSLSWYETPTRVGFMLDRVPSGRGGGCGRRWTGTSELPLAAKRSRSAVRVGEESIDRPGEQLFTRGQGRQAVGTKTSRRPLTAPAGRVPGV
jgi:hypothetical protein